MNTFERFEGDLPMLLDELVSPHAPDYLDDVFARTVGARQRPAWTFPQRWLPASAMTFAVPTSARPFVRVVALALLLLAIMLAGIVVVGSIRADLRSSFGVAGNGQVAYTSNNDIFLVDPITGASKSITTGPELESAPTFSPDGTRLAFKRHEAGMSIDSYDIVVANDDGSNSRTIATLPITYWSGRESLQWTPDGRSLIVNTATGELRLYDTETSAEPRVLATGVTGVEFRPPHGEQILFRRLDLSGTGLYTMNADGSNVRPLIVIKLGGTLGEEDLGSARWSPDGSQIVFTRTPPGLSDKQHIYVMKADGSEVQPLPMGAGTEYANNMAWSPDGRRIAFERWDTRGIRPIGVLTIDSGEVIDAGPPLGDNGVAFDWSPDGKTILAVPGDGPRLIVIDPDDGSWASMGPGLSIEQGVLNDLHPSWQRVKP